MTSMFYVLWKLRETLIPCEDKQNFIKRYITNISIILHNFPQKEIISITIVHLHFNCISWLIPKSVFNLRPTPIPNHFLIYIVCRNRYKDVIFRINIIHRDKQVPLWKVKSLKDQSDEDFGPNNSGRPSENKSKHSHIA